MKPTHVSKTLPTILDRPFTVPEPFGVVLVIGAWNYPLHLTLAPVAGAIAAGNCVVMKPSEISPHTAKAIEDLVPRYVDPECFKVRGFIADKCRIILQSVIASHDINVISCIQL